MLLSVSLPRSVKLVEGISTLRRLVKRKRAQRMPMKPEVTAASSILDSSRF